MASHPNTIDTLCGCLDTGYSITCVLRPLHLARWLILAHLGSQGDAVLACWDTIALRDGLASAGATS